MKTQFNVGQVLECLTVGEKNVEGLEVGRLYIVSAKSQLEDGEWLYLLNTQDGKDIYTTGQYFDFYQPDPAPKKDNVNHPDHYTKGKFEVIEVIEDATKDLSGLEAVCIANVIKYVLRYPYKNGTEDLKKANWYLDRAIKEREKNNE